VSLGSIAPPAFAQDQQTTPQATQGPMTVERITGGFMIAPDFKVTRFDHHTSEMAGVYGGWLSDRTLLIGGGVHFLTNGNRDRRLAYGGLMIGWMSDATRPIGFGVRGLVGGGEATLLEPVQIAFFPDVRDPRTAPRPQPTITTADVRVHDGFFVAEPEANVVVNLSRNIRVTGGIGYRLIGNSRHFDITNPTDRLRGPSGTISLEIGGS
jgi:hypothetical protein